ncbi:DUF1801 domain-containing protein [Aureispira anguillae]|uniref:DUF1801 domain-containing protein n=1 Tax=Aureispira anguillae TaxID=2864201 RepID=A0A915YI32_9BACT|nr:DUF1801 domain-containing protein [Aureispira anguillae]BDS13455.1 DUF1801 domain-containing protein [Aureispira anguillae]
MTKKLKTTLNNGDVEAFLNSVENEQRRKDAFTILTIFKEITGEEAKMWGTSIVGFGSYHYVYATGREGDWMMTGFSPRKTSLTLYLMNGFEGCEDLLNRLGKYKTGKACLYVNRLEQIDIEVLKELIAASYQYMKEKYH